MLSAGQGLSPAERAEMNADRAMARYDKPDKPDKPTPEDFTQAALNVASRVADRCLQAEASRSTAAGGLYTMFQGTYALVGESPVTIDEKTFKVAHRSETGWDAYSVSTKGNDGRWLTLQVVSVKNSYAVRLFDDSGKLVASARQSPSSVQCLDVSAEAKEMGQDTLLAGAIAAVMRRDAGLGLCVEGAPRARIKTEDLE